MESFRFTIDESNPDFLAEVRCPRCEACLNIHEPDCDLPDRLLATCGACLSWYLIDCSTERMIRLPDPREL